MLIDVTPTSRRSEEEREEGVSVQMRRNTPIIWLKEYCDIVNLSISFLQQALVTACGKHLCIGIAINWGGVLSLIASFIETDEFC